MKKFRINIAETSGSRKNG